MSTGDGGTPPPSSAGDLDVIRRRVSEARAVSDPTERALRLYVLGRALFERSDATTAKEAVAVMHEAVQLGNSDAAYDLGMIVLTDAQSGEELGVAVTLLGRAAAGGHEGALSALKKIRDTPVQ